MMEFPSVSNANLERKQSPLVEHIRTTSSSLSKRWDDFDGVKIGVAPFLKHPPFCNQNLDLEHGH